MAFAQDRQICCALQRPLDSGRARFVVANLPTAFFFIRWLVGPVPFAVQLHAFHIKRI